MTKIEQKLTVSVNLLNTCSPLSGISSQTCTRKFIWSILFAFILIIRLFAFSVSQNLPCQQLLIFFCKIHLSHPLLINGLYRKFGSFFSFRCFQTRKISNKLKILLHTDSAHCSKYWQNLMKVTRYLTRNIVWGKKEREWGQYIWWDSY